MILFWAFYLKKDKVFLIQQNEGRVSIKIPNSFFKAISEQTQTKLIKNCLLLRPIIKVNRVEVILYLNA